MNRKAQVPILIMPLVAIALSILVIASFTLFSSNLKSFSGDYSTLSSTLITQESTIKEDTFLLVKKTIASQDIKSAIQQNAPNLIVTKGAEMFYGKLNRGEFSIIQDQINKDQYKFEMKSITLNSESGKNKISRTINLCMLFSEQGDFRQYC
jgi:hypothetical protein